MILSRPDLNESPHSSSKVAVDPRAYSHGPCVWRSSSLIKELDFLKDFVGLNENKRLARHMQRQGYTVALWDSYETFLVRNYRDVMGYREEIRELVEDRRNS